MELNSQEINKLDKRILTSLHSQTTIDNYGAVIRELVQNSMDANATRIIIRLDLNSIGAIISDNGYGISPDNLDKIGERYSTSKLKSWSDLKNVKSFGFRGEALHFISSMTDFSIISKHKSYKSAFKVYTNGSSKKICIYDLDKNSKTLFHMELIQKAGTIVSFRNLFHNLPVRRKHIISLSSHKLIEQVREAVFVSLIKNPLIHIIVYEDNFKTGELSKCFEVNCQSGSYSDIYKNIYGITNLVDSMPISAKFMNYTICGFIGEAQANKNQFVFINNRPFCIPSEHSKELNKLFNSFNTLDSEQDLIKSSGPFCQFQTFLLYVSTPTETSELIQTPSKMVYYSKHWPFIFEMVKKIFIRYAESRGVSNEVLREKFLKTPSPKKQSIQMSFSPSLARFAYNSNMKSNDIQEIEYNPQDSYGTGSPRKKRKSNSQLGTSHSCVSSHSPSHIKIESSISRDDLKNRNYRIVKQIDKKFILLSMNKEKANNLIILDQHASDERVKVEKLFKEFIESVVDPTINISLRLLNPIEISLSHSEIGLFHEYIENLKMFGINFQSSNNKILVTHLPHYLLEKVKDDCKFLKLSLLQHLHDLENKVKSTTLGDNWIADINALPRVLVEIINSKSCRSAIMFGEHLTMHQMEVLVRDLGNCKLPFQCAHGRPTIVPLVNLSN
ncbi:uncharacterized protein RJT21DRAFT_8724 [Scheffersomyces amazonensis]|uniref:uncharacterized protein n=1 Tax=Scheffersomyces amazonensis TaxID=1078765 RepID=UPI00315D040B